ncbi:hypothetical protein LIER_04024 [Lithospermum erythrorhizon]|uniref:AAA+ ATPase domain-containing protein n=1 Tax=Lithospermum erythrorhizon TaxID=34254 RepID=A0AAV3NZX0_LITER
MIARRLKKENEGWNLLIRGGKCFVSSCYHDQPFVQTPKNGTLISQGALVRKYVSLSFLSSGVDLGRRYRILNAKSSLCWRASRLRFYSSKSDGGSASEDKQTTVIDHINNDKGGNRKTDGIGANAKQSNAHARLGEEDQQEWLRTENLAIESKKKESPFLTKRERFKNEFLRRIVPWEKITLSWDTFPYFINENSKNILVECVASHLEHKKVTASYGSRLDSSSGRILLQSIPGTELYRERLVRVLARDLKVPLLVLDSSVLAPYDFSDDCESYSESDEDVESGEECTSESENEDENAAGNEEYASSGEAKSGGSDDEIDVQATAEALKKCVPYNIEDFETLKVSGESESTSETSKADDTDSSTTKRAMKKGDRVKYIGPSVTVEADNRIVLGKIQTSDGSANAFTVIRCRALPSGQRGEVYEVNGDKVAVILDACEEKADSSEIDEKATDSDKKPSIYWIHVKDIEHDLDALAEDGYIAMEALCKVLQSVQPLVVYFPDSSLWLSRAASKSNRREFIHKVQEMFDSISGPVVLICGQNKVESGQKEKEKFNVVLPNLGRLAKLPLTLKRLAEGLTTNKRSEDHDIYKLFANVMIVHPPKEDDLLRTFSKQIEEDRRIVVARSNIIELHKVLEENELACSDLLQVDTDGTILTKRKAEKVVGWARNHYLSYCPDPSIKGDRMYIPLESLEIAIMRLKNEDLISKKPSQNLKILAKDEYESNFVSAVVPPGEIGVKFDDIGALEDVKKALDELVILPMKRPELFARGNLLRPCKGILLFGPPGTGKTLLAKALATEAGANFISVSGSTLTSKWFGDAEKLTKALFSFASKLAPVIIFMDEVDSLLGARGGGFEHEATRRMRNEFMAAWDGLRSKESQRILILGATNRPFDLDDAVIRRLPRRIYVDLPDAANRLKILKVILAHEHLESGFPFEKLANETEGYSGSDLKNLCIAAAYKPVQELLTEEKTEERTTETMILRPLDLDDFIQSKAKVGPSVAYDAASMNELRKWNEQYGEGGSRRKSPFGF